jgi:hypothetical protein
MWNASKRWAWSGGLTSSFTRNGRVAAQTHEAVLKQMESPQATTMPVVAFTKGRADKRSNLFAPPAQRSAQLNPSTLAAALLLGSPDFQRR